MAESPLILLVDDVADARDMYSQYLTFHGFRVIEASDGEAGFQQAQEFLPDLILMDLGMPRVDGWEATRRLKADPRTEHIPVIALSGFGPDATARARAEGRAKFDALFLKPCPPPTILAKIRDVLNGRPRPN